MAKESEKSTCLQSKETLLLQPHFSGRRPQEVVPVILETKASENYGLVDSGHSRKLERYGSYLIIRPEKQAIWRPSLDRDIWQKADAIFIGNTDERSMEHWLFPHSIPRKTWLLFWNGLPFLCRFTSFRHVGVFPEQDAHWRFMESLIQQTARPIRVLNLFGYTGLASLVAARAGAEVTHVDASKKAISWARENQKIAGLLDKPIRWICEDAMKFVIREEKRRKNYDLILLDPPTYGRGPQGETWQFFDNLPKMVSLCRAILSEKPLAFIITAYSIRISFYALHELMCDIFAGLGGKIESGELVLREEKAKRSLSTSLFSRWTA